MPDSRFRTVVVECPPRRVPVTGELSQAAAALLEGEEKYRTLFEASLDAILLETLAGRVLDCNGAACTLYGYAREELIGLQARDLVPEEVARALPAMIPQL